MCSASITTVYSVIVEILKIQCFLRDFGLFEIQSGLFATYCSSHDGVIPKIRL